MNKKAFIHIAFLFRCFCTMEIASAQDAAHYTLDRCISKGRSSGPSAKIASKTWEIGYWNYKSFKADLLPRLVFEADAPGFLRSINPILQDDGTQTFVEQNLASSRAGLSIMQPIVATGGALVVSSGISRLDILGGNALVSYQTTPLLIGFRQPLFQYNDLRWQKKIAPVRYNYSQRRYLETLEDISIEVAGNFFDVCVAEMNLANAALNLEINDSVYQISQGRYAVGKIAENELLQSELAWMKARQDLESSKLELQQATAQLKISLGLADAENLKLQLPSRFESVTADPEIALQYAHLYRSDMLDFQTRIIEAERNVAQVRTANRFSADINANYGLNQQGSDLSSTYTNPLDQQSLSIGLSIPVLQWGKAKAQSSIAMAQLEQVHEQVNLDQRNFDQNVRMQVSLFNQMQEQVVMAAKSDSIAMRRYEVAKSRYLIGKIDITNLQIAQLEKDQARISYLQTLRSYWVAYYRLRRATLFDFIEGKPISMPVPDWK